MVVLGAIGPLPYQCNWSSGLGAIGAVPSVQNRAHMAGVLAFPFLLIFPSSSRSPSLETFPDIRAPTSLLVVP